MWLTIMFVRRNRSVTDSNVKFWLVDAVEHQKHYPTSFELPDEWNRLRVEVGEWAKLIFAFPTEPEHKFERMWVQVKVVTPTSYGGVLDNEPSTTGFVSIGHRVGFEARHIISIWPPRPYLAPLLPPPPP
jgi:uncharacterized protein YegJ (DUF2314 family)